MHQGSLTVAVLSFLGALAAFAIAATVRNPVSLHTLLGFVLLANAGVRYRLARR